MARNKCHLCGGRIAGGKCVDCGMKRSYLDPKDKLNERQLSEWRQPGENASQDSSRQIRTEDRTVHKQAGADQQKAGQIPAWQKPVSSHKTASENHNTPRPIYTPRTAGRKKIGITKWIAILTVIASIASFAFEAMEKQQEEQRAQRQEALGYVWENVYPEYSYDLDDDAELFDRYSYCETEIPETDIFYEVILEEGFYEVGVDIPEGIYEWFILSEARWDNDDMPADETEDLRFYNGAEIEIEEDVQIEIATDNAQMGVGNYIKNVE